MDTPRSGNNSHRPQQVAEGLRHHAAAADMVNDLRAHDMAALADLNPEQRAQQLAARQRLYDHIGAIWDQAKTRGLNPADLPDYNAVAAMRDLTNELVDHTVQAHLDAGEELAR